MRVMVEPFVEVTAKLPVCLHLDRRSFPFEVNGVPVEITVRNVPNEEGTWLGKASNAEVESDSFSHFRFSTLTIRFPHSRACPLNRCLDEYADVVFCTVNHFLAACRVALGRHGLKEVTSYEQFIPPVDVTIVGAENPDRAHMSAAAACSNPTTTTTTTTTIPCVPGGGTCAASGDCCAPDVCDLSTLTCVGCVLIGDGCATDSDCCSPSLCIGGACF
jgi:hypothetical protein